MTPERRAELEAVRREIAEAREVIATEATLAAALSLCGVRIPIDSLAALERRFRELERRVGMAPQPSFAEFARHDWLGAKN